MQPQISKFPLGLFEYIAFNFHHHFSNLALHLVIEHFSKAKYQLNIWKTMQDETKKKSFKKLVF